MENSMNQDTFESRLCDQGKALFVRVLLVAEEAKGKGLSGVMEIAKEGKKWEEHRDGCPQCAAAFEAEKAKEQK